MCLSEQHVYHFAVIILSTLNILPSPFDSFFTIECSQKISKSLLSLPVAETFVWALIVFLLKFLNYCLLPLLLFLIPTKYTHSCYEPFPYKQSLFQITSHLTTFIHPGNQIFPLLFILSDMPDCSFNPISNCNGYWLPTWLCMMQSHFLPLAANFHSPSQKHHYHTFHYFTCIPLGTFLPKKNVFWVFLSQARRTSAHSFWCDRLTLELHRELTIAISSLALLIYCIKVLLHSKLFHAEILPLFWHFAENLSDIYELKTYIYSF